VDDRRHALTDYADKEAIAVIFTCNHCPYARAWEDCLIEIQADYATRGAQLVAISANDAKKYPEDSFPRMKERSEEKGFNFPYLYDESQEIARAYGVERTRGSSSSTRATRYATTARWTTTTRIR
jgi:peroxiredoxin